MRWGVKGVGRISILGACVWETERKGGGEGILARRLACLTSLLRLPGEYMYYQGKDKRCTYG